jgi:glycosyltransferase involved in cell wall biosynthesis
LAQSYKNKEIVIIDDFSNDDSLEVLKSYQKNKNVKLIYNKKRFSKFSAFNQLHALIKAFKVSSGKIICLLDSDDFFEKNKLEEIEKYFSKNCNENFIQDIPYFYYSKDRKTVKLLNKNNYSLWPSFYPTSTMSLKRDFFKKCILSIFYKKFPLVEIDARIAIYVNFKNSKITILNKKLTNYYQNDSGINLNNKKFSFNWWIKRAEVHDFVRLFYMSNKIKIVQSYDYLITKSVSFFLKIIKINYKNNL